jgi:nucleotide-binding universal stress UspA family protein
VAEELLNFNILDILHRRQGRELLDVLQRSLPPSILSSRMLRMGYPADEIVSAAADWYADLIIIGTRGRGRLAQLLLGSTAEAVIRRATCPVLTVSHDPQPLQRPDEAKWVGLGADAATPESAHAG